MRADQRAFTALNAGFGIPNRNFGCDAAFFILGRAGRPSAVNNFFKSGNRQFVTAVGDDFAGNFPDEFRSIGRNRRQAMESRGNVVRIFNFVHMSQRSINGFEVFLNNGIAFFAVGFLNRVFNFGNCLIFGQNVRNSEEAGLHDGVNALAHAGFAGNFNSVNGVEFQFFADDFFLNFNRQMIPNFFGAVRSV